MNDIQQSDSHISNILANPETNQPFPISSRHDYYCLQSSDGRDFAVVHSRTTVALRVLQDLPSIRLEAVFGDGYCDRPDQLRRKGNKTIFPISINIYGSKEIAQESGRKLSKAHTYLQHPIRSDGDIPYQNPHYYAVPGAREADHYSAPHPETEDQQAPAVDMTKLFEELENTRTLPVWNVDCHLRTPLLEYGSFVGLCECVANTLAFTARHQKKALYFIVQNEASFTNDDVSLWKARQNEDGSQ